MAGEFDDYNGRKPSFNFTKQGPVLRGFRSKPGAPMHDPTTNNPMSGTYQPTNWDSVFQPRAGQGPTAPTGAPGGVAQNQGGWAESILNPNANNTGWASGVIGKQTPSLETMAAGGSNHAQEWSQPKPMTAQAKGLKTSTDIFNKYRSGSGLFGFDPNTSAGRSDDRFGWGSAFA